MLTLSYILLEKIEAQKRWSEDQKNKIKNSRLIGTKQLSDQLAASEHKPSL